MTELDAIKGRAVENKLNGKMLVTNADFTRLFEMAEESESLKAENARLKAWPALMNKEKDG